MLGKQPHRFVSAKAMGDIIICRNASFGYDGHVVVRDLSFTIQGGDYLCIAGENGSGKSTLVKGLLQLMKPMQGTLVYDGLDRRAVGYLSQASAAKKDFPAGVYEIVLSGNLGRMGLRPFYTRKEKQGAEENLERLGIADLKDRCYRELSGGQQRRVLVARALCGVSLQDNQDGTHRLLILDEPAAGLDPLVTADLYALLRKVNQGDITIVMVSHDITSAAAYAKHILHLDQGRYFFGTASEYRDTDLYEQFTH
jgi:zinc transport system ATP-binding protein